MNLFSGIPICSPEILGQDLNYYLSDSGNENLMVISGNCSWQLQASNNFDCSTVYTCTLRNEMTGINQEMKQIHLTLLMNKTIQKNV